MLQVKKFKYLGVLFTSKGRMDHEFDRWFSAASAVLEMLYQTVVVVQASDHDSSFRHTVLRGDFGVHPELVGGTVYPT